MTDPITVTEEMIEAGRKANPDTISSLGEEFCDHGWDEDFIAIYRAMREKDPEFQRLAQELDDATSYWHGRCD